MKINTLEMESTDTGCVAKASGFDGVMLTCPRCQALLPRDHEHRCGTAVAKKVTPAARILGQHKAKEPCSDCADGWCTMNCGPAVKGD